MTLRLDKVVCHYQLGGDTIRAVDGVSLTIARGELVALYGPSGSGKSTLLLIAAGLVAPDAGVVTWDDVPVPHEGRAAARWRRQQLGVVFQLPFLMPGMDIGRSVGLRLEACGVRPSEAERRTGRQLRQLGLGERLTHRPDQLSIGQQQRAAVAAALSTDPPLILADEPTGALDARAGEDLLRLLQRLARDERRAVLVVTHDPRVMRFADRSLALEDGRLATIDTLLAAEPARDH